MEHIYEKTNHFKHDRLSLGHANKLNIVMYHYTRDLVHSRYPDIKGLDIKLFEQQIDFFKKNFSIVTMEEVIDAVERETTLPDNALLLTFDDGYIDNYTYALPVLEAADVQGSFFIPGKTFTTHQLLDVNKIHYILANADIPSLVSDVMERMNYYRDDTYCYPTNTQLWKEYAVASRFDPKEVVFVKRILQSALPETIRNKISSDLFEKYVGISEEKLAYELYMTKGQIRTMKKHGMFIGIHGYDHYWLGNLSEEEMKRDISQALETMAEFIDQDSWVMNYPYGSYNQNVLNYIKEKGACIGLTTDVRVADLKHDNPLELPRLDCNDFPPKSENYIRYNKEKSTELTEL